MSLNNLSIGYMYIPKRSKHFFSNVLTNRSEPIKMYPSTQ